MKLVFKMIWLMAAQLDKFLRDKVFKIASDQNMMVIKED